MTANTHDIAPEPTVTRRLVVRFGSRARPYAALSLLAGLIFWEAVGQGLGLMYFPPASAVFARFIELIAEGRIVEPLTHSLMNLAMGFSAGSLAGVIVGFAMGWNRTIEKALDPYVYGFLTTPTITFVPIYFAIFGLSRWAIVGLIIQYTIFITIVNTVTAVKGVSRELMEMAAVFGASQHQIRFQIAVPAALPLIMAGLRLGMGRAVKGMINGELLIALVGLGALSVGFGRAFDAVGVLAVLIVVIIVAIIAVWLVQFVDRRINAWVPSTERR